jgi:hypothetical protein
VLALIVVNDLIVPCSSSHLLIALFISCNPLELYNLQDKLEAKVVVAGFSTTCSQKIHNQLVRFYFVLRS